MHKLSKIIGALAAVLISSTASAGPIYYDEAIDGALDPSSPLSLGVGTNVVLGTACWISSPSCSTYSNFAFQVPTGMMLTGYSYQKSNLDLDGFRPFYWFGGLTIASASLELEASTEQISWLGGTKTLLLEGLEFGPAGDYRQLYSAYRFGEGGSWDFRIELTVISTQEEIPVTPALFLFAFGLLSTAFLFRPRQSIKAHLNK